MIMMMMVVVVVVDASCHSGARPWLAALCDAEDAGEGGGRGRFPAVPQIGMCPLSVHCRSDNRSRPVSFPLPRHPESGMLP